MFYVAIAPAVVEMLLLVLGNPGGGVRAHQSVKT